MPNPPWHLILPLVFRGPCCPMLTEFVYVVWIFLTILTLVSLIPVYRQNYSYVFIHIIRLREIAVTVATDFIS